MSVVQQLFFILLVAGLMLIGAEVFVPGGVMGALGGMALLAAVILGFAGFPAAGPFIAVGILFLVGIVIVLWIKIFPGTPLGKRMTVAGSLRTSKGTDDHLGQYLDKEGIAVSDLRPSGLARIDGKRVDVITRGEMISREESIRVVAVESNHLIVERCNT